MKSILQIIAVILFVSVSIEAKDTIVQGLLGGSRSITPEVTNSPNVVSQEPLNIPPGRTLAKTEPPEIISVSSRSNNCVSANEMDCIYKTIKKMIDEQTPDEIKYSKCVVKLLNAVITLPTDVQLATALIILDKAKQSEEGIVSSFPNCKYKNKALFIDSIPLP